MDSKADELDRKLRDILDKNDENPKGPLFHYTSFSGLSAILESKFLWLTNHRFLNDPSEIQHGRNIVLKGIQKETNNNFPLRNFFLTTFDQMIDGYNAFITSFCEKPDYLPAWRYYGANGAGFSLGFNEKFFERVKSAADDKNKTLLFKVDYQKDSSSLLEDCFRATREIMNDWSSKPLGEQILEYIGVLTSSLLSVLPHVKNKDYEDEHEWRICFIRIYHLDSNTWLPSDFPLEELYIDEIDISKRSSFEKNIRKSVPRLKLLKFDFKDIQCIYVGPRLDFTSAKLAIEKKLLDLGVDKSEVKNIEIRKSERSFQ